MIKRRVLIIVISVLSIVFVMACACSPSAEDQSQSLALQIQKSVQSKLDSLDRDASDTASKLSKTGLTGVEARKVLNQLYSKYGFLSNVAAVDTSDKMVTMEPELYRKYEGTDIGDQEATIEFNNTWIPMLSKMFTAVEGFDAVVIIYPILSSGNEHLGSLSILFKPETLFAGVAEPLLKGKEDIEIDVMQLDGLTIYDSKISDTGKNLFTDPLYQPYPELISLGKRIVAENSGTGNYTFPRNDMGQPVKKQAFWASVDLYGTQWRVVSVRQMEKIRVATAASYPPFNYVDEKSGQPAGFDIDLMNAIAEKENLDVEYITISFKQLLDGMAQGNYDAAVSDISITEERKKDMLFSDSYFVTGHVVTVNKDNTSIMGKGNLSGKTVGVEEATTSYADVSKMAGVNIKSYAEPDAAFLDLMDGSIDAVVSDETIARSYVSENPEKLKIAGGTFTQENYGIAVAKDKPELLMKINAGLKAVKSEGLLEKLSQKWLVK